LTFDSVPSEGEVIFLGVTSNESRGGSPENFLSFLHPDIGDLCIQAAQTLRLKVAAVDVISEDATVSWRENNAVICEINSQPQIGDLETYPHIFYDLLDRIPGKNSEVSLLVSNKFDIPVCDTFNKSRDIISARVSPSYLIYNGSPTLYYSKIEFLDDVAPSDQLKIEKLLFNTFPICRVREGSTTAD
jgi:hypothetical protein